MLIVSFCLMHLCELTMSFKVTSLALGQSYDCPSASEVALKDMGKIRRNLTTAKHSMNNMHNSWEVLLSCEAFP